jgi:hypothetical protein
MSASSTEENMKTRYMPRAIIFDLDATLWTPELYEMSGGPFRKIETGKGKGNKGYSHQHKIVDGAGYAIDLFPEARLGMVVCVCMCV